MFRMKKASVFLPFLAFIILVSCTVADAKDSTTPVFTATHEPVLLPTVVEDTFSPLLLTAEPTPLVVTPTVAAEPTALDISTPTAVPTDFATVTPMSPPESLIWVGDISWYRSLQDNMWWSSDSQTLFYQNPPTEEAWAYDLESGQTSSIPYTPRSVDELEPLLAPTLPVGAKLFDVSPTKRYILYKIPLSEPIPLAPPRFDNEMNPAYFYELWLQDGDQHFELGLVDRCFGRLGPPQWSASEHIGVVTTEGTPDAEPACMYDNWLVDIDNLRVGPMPVPTEGAHGYSVEDVSADGKWLLLRDNQNYLFNTETGEQIAIPGADTSNAGLVELPGTPASLFLSLERSETILQEHIWYYDPTRDSSIELAVIPGNIKGWLVSPNQKFLVLAVDNHFYETAYDNITTGIWVMPLPDTME